MAVMLRKKGEQVPEDAVLLTSEKVLSYQMNVVGNWPNYKEVFFMRSGTGILASMSAISAWLLNSHFRHKLRVGSYGRLSSYLAVVASPAIMSGLFHTAFVQQNVILQKYDCPMCLQTRAGAFQGSLGLLYPLLLAPTASFMFASRHFTYRLPLITENPKEILRLILKFTKSASNMCAGLFAINVLLAMYITSQEMKEIHFVNSKLIEYEKKIESGSLSEDELMPNFDI